MELRDINLLDLDVWVEDVPHHWFTYLRTHAPVYKHPEPDGPGFWVITKHEDVAMVERDVATFSSSAHRGGVVDLAEIPLEDREQSRTVARHDGNMLLEMDPPEHAAYRGLVHGPFRPRMIESLEDDVRDRAVRILDQAISKRECDFVTEVAYELPSQIIAVLLGVPIEDRHIITGWSDRTSEDPEYATAESPLQVQQEMLAYAHKLAETRRREPGDDLVSLLLQSKVEGRPLSELDFGLYFELLALAGEVTMRSALSQGIVAFIEHPEQYELLVEDPTLIDTAVEELFRWGTPAHYFRRNATRDTEIRGVPIAAGDKVSIWYPSANRDDDVFEDPFRFDIRRHPNDHISFGGGRHFCLGAHLARLEMRVLFEELAKRVTHLEARGEITRLRSNLEHGIKHLPVRFDGVRHPAGV